MTDLHALNVEAARARQKAKQGAERIQLDLHEQAAYQESLSVQDGPYITGYLTEEAELCRAVLLAAEAQIQHMAALLAVAGREG